MPTTKLFLVQFLIEADVSEWPDFDETQAADYFLSALKLSGADKKLGAQVYLLARKPDGRGDFLIEEYEDRGYVVEILQNAHTVGTDVPMYFAMVTNPQSKTPYSYPTKDCETIRGAKEAARLRVDKRIARKQRQS